MKAILAVLFLAVACVVRAHGEALAGPITNTANGHIYYLLGQTNWLESEDQAKALGGHLVTINDECEQNWVYSTFSIWGGVNRALLIGLNDRQTEGAFRWASGEQSTYRNWNAGEPNDGNAVHLENVAHMYAPNQATGGVWNDFVETDTSTGSGERFAPFNGVVEIDPFQTQVSLTTIQDAINSTNLATSARRLLSADVKKAARSLQSLSKKIQRRIAPGNAELAAEIQASIDRLLGDIPDHQLR